MTYITYRNVVRGGTSHRQQAQKLVKFGCAVLKLCVRTDRQMHKHRLITVHNKTTIIRKQSPFEIGL